MATPEKEVVAKKSAKATKKGKAKNGKVSLSDIVRGILSRASGPMKSSEVAEKALPIWERSHGKAAKQFGGMVWHALQATARLESRGQYVLAKEGKTEGELRPVGQRTPEGKKASVKRAKAEAKAAKGKKAKAAKKGKKAQATQPTPAQASEGQ